MPNQFTEGRNIKLVFIGSSLEAGKDGVGDYIQSLSAGLLSLGVQTRCVAFSDKYCNKVIGLNSGMLRLPASFAYQKRLALLDQWLSEQQPDWVSWQWVSYGYHPKGFVGGEAMAFASSLSRYRVHMMVHETWLGLNQADGLKDRLYGWYQSRGFKKLLGLLKPQLIHTSIPVYQAAIQGLGYACSLLPLFGNVPIHPLTPQLKSEVLSWLPSLAERDQLLLGCTFGTLHRQWQPADTIRWMQELARLEKKTPTLLVIGRSGAAAPAILQEFRAAGMSVLESGECAPDRVSGLLQLADFGIAPHPWQLIGKSGAAAAMLEHGLPVIVPRDDWQIRTLPSIMLGSASHLAKLTELTPRLKCNEWLKLRMPPASRLTAVCNQFIHDLGLSAL